MHASIHRVIRFAVLVGLAGPVVGILARAAEADQPLQVIQTTPLVVDRRSADPSMPPSGEVRVLVLIDNMGQLHDVLLLGSTHHAFTEAAVAGLQQWQYVPPQVQGRAVGTRATLRLFIESHGGATSVSIGESLTNRVRPPDHAEFEDRLAEARELDRPLQFVRRASPLTPAALAGQARDPARVVVDFYVDETGIPRMPMVKQSTEPLLSDAALDAIERWQFEPPTRKGLPVVVRVQQEFVFFDQPPTTDVAPTL